MLYAPHRLFVRKLTETRDERNRTVSVEENWTEVSPCRCDDNTTLRIKDDTGNEYVPYYHIVAPRSRLVSAGDWVRVCDGACIRGEGKVVKVMRTNYLDYMSIYV